MVITICLEAPADRMANGALIAMANATICHHREDGKANEMSMAPGTTQRYRMIAIIIFWTSFGIMSVMTLLAMVKIFCVLFVSRKDENFAIWAASLPFGWLCVLAMHELLRL